MLVLFVGNEYDRRRPGLPVALVVMEYDSDRTKESTAIAQNISHTGATDGYGSLEAQLG